MMEKTDGNPDDIIRQIEQQGFKKKVAGGNACWKCGHVTVVFDGSSWQVRIPFYQSNWNTTPFAAAHYLQSVIASEVEEEKNRMNRLKSAKQQVNEFLKCFKEKK